ncbi:hypothetical protein SAMN05216337_100447 [Bradyrhizobium brasilense]|uniref:Uncharacterized protein n=1 Tax=Bradyrhizobium brasilense TaxID=1419277 RepID=A0A1G6N7T6_9BRAD|nr:hypothetical protein SAMN05216337_100447 [Bradyrhizobium brasilense]
MEKDAYAADRSHRDHAAYEEEVAASGPLCSCNCLCQFRRRRRCCVWSGVAGMASMTELRIIPYLFEGVTWTSAYPISRDIVELIELERQSGALRAGLTKHSCPAIG